MKDKSATKMEDKAETSMQEPFKCVLVDHNKGMKQQMAKQSIKHAA
jgi:hypothetical protein